MGDPPQTVLSKLDRFTHAYTDKFIEPYEDSSCVACYYSSKDNKYLMVLMPKSFYREEAFKTNPNWKPYHYAPGYGVQYFCKSNDVVACQFGD